MFCLDASEMTHRPTAAYQKGRSCKNVPISDQFVLIKQS